MLSNEILNIKLSRKLIFREDHSFNNPSRSLKCCKMSSFTPKPSYAIHNT